MFHYSMVKQPQVQLRVGARLRGGFLRSNEGVARGERLFPHGTHASRAIPDVDDVCGRWASGWIQGGPDIVKPLCVAGTAGLILLPANVLVWLSQRGGTVVFHDTIKAPVIQEVSDPNGG